MCLSYVFLTRGIQITLGCLLAGAPFDNLQKTSYLPELLHLLVEVWVKFLRHILHPQQGPSIFNPALLHAVHGQPGIRDGPMSKSLYFLVESTQRVPQSQPAQEDTTTVMKWKSAAIPIPDVFFIHHRSRNLKHCLEHSRFIKTWQTLIKMCMNLGIIQTLLTFWSFCS